MKPKLPTRKSAKADLWLFWDLWKPVMDTSGGVQEELGLACTLMTERPSLILEKKKAGDSSLSKVANQTNPDLGLFCTKLWFRSGNRVIFAHDETAP